VLDSASVTYGVRAFGQGGEVFGVGGAIQQRRGVGDHPRAAVHTRGGHDTLVGLRQGRLVRRRARSIWPKSARRLPAGEVQTFTGRISCCRRTGGPM
jgi:hypothetical protein